MKTFEHGFNPNNGINIYSIKSTGKGEFYMSGTAPNIEVGDRITHGKFTFVLERLDELEDAKGNWNDSTQSKNAHYEGVFKLLDDSMECKGIIFAV